MKKTLQFILAACLLLSLFLSLGAALYYTEPLGAKTTSAYEPISLAMIGLSLIAFGSLIRRRTIRRISGPKVDKA